VKPTASGSGSPTGEVDRVPPDYAATAVSPLLVFPSVPLYFSTSPRKYPQPRTRRRARPCGATAAPLPSA